MSNIRNPSGISADAGVVTPISEVLDAGDVVETDQLAFHDALAKGGEPRESQSPETRRAIERSLDRLQASSETEGASGSGESEFVDASRGHFRGATPAAPPVVGAAGAYGEGFVSAQNRIRRDRPTSPPVGDGGDRGAPASSSPSTRQSRAAPDHKPAGAATGRPATSGARGRRSDRQAGYLGARGRRSDRQAGYLGARGRRSDRQAGYLGARGRRSDRQAGYLGARGRRSDRQAGYLGARGRRSDRQAGYLGARGRRSDRAGRLPRRERPAQRPAGRLPRRERPAQRPAGRLPRRERPAQRPAGRLPRRERPAVLRRPERRASLPAPVRMTHTIPTLRQSTCPARQRPPEPPNRGGRVRRKAYRPR